MYRSEEKTFQEVRKVRTKDKETTKANKDLKPD